MKRRTVLGGFLGAVGSLFLPRKLSADPPEEQIAKPEEEKTEQETPVRITVEMKSKEGRDWKWVINAKDCVIDCRLDAPLNEFGQYQLPIPDVTTKSFTITGHFTTAKS